MTVRRVRGIRGHRDGGAALGVLARGLGGAPPGILGLGALAVLGRLTPGKLRAFGSRLTSAVVGSVVYFLIRAIVLQMGMDANDMKLLSAIIVALALCVPVVWEKIQLKRSYARAMKFQGAGTEGGSATEGGR